MKYSNLKTKLDFNKHLLIELEWISIVSIKIALSEGFYHIF